jgi:hypothetical protein
MIIPVSFDTAVLPVTTFADRTNFCVHCAPGALPLAELNMAFSQQRQDILIYILLVEQIPFQPERLTESSPGQF